MLRTGRKLRPVPPARFKAACCGFEHWKTQPLFDIAFCDVKHLALLALTRSSNRLEAGSTFLECGDTSCTLCASLIFKFNRRDEAFFL
jgi:hypothetical protein